MSDAVEDIHVLAVDDNADLVEVVAEFLEREHDAITVTTATGAEDALETLETVDVDCIVSDYDMPGQDGLDLLREVRERYPDRPFILFTGKGSEEIASEAISAGVTEYLQKETSSEQYTVLANRIERAVSEYRARREKEETERRFTTLVENLPGMAYRCRNERGWPMEFVSDGCEELTGYAAAELESGAIDWEDVVHPDDREKLWETVQEAIDDGEPFEVRYRIRTRGGEVKYCWERGEAIDADGETVALEGLITDITERRRKQAELEREREFTHDALNALDDVFFVIDPETEELLRWNDRLPEATGYSDDELSQIRIGELIAEETVESVRAAVAEAISSGSVTVEADLVTVDGERIPHEFRGTALFGDDAGEQSADDIVGIAGVGRDISERRERERRLEEYRTLVENVGDPMYTLDDEGRVEMINSAMVEHIGYTREEIEGNTPRVFMSEADVQRGTDVVVDLLKGDEEWKTWEMDVVRKDGTVIHSETQTSLIVEDGEYVGSVGIIRDITERKERERELERFETVVQAVGDPVYALDDDGVLTFVNDAIEEMTGYTAEELTDTHVERILSDEDVKRGREEIRAMLTDPNRRATKFEVEVETAGGDTVPSELHIALLPTDDDEFRGTAGIIRDITERKQREQRLEQFVGVVSHDLRNPLNVIQGRVEVMERSDDPTAEIEAIEGAADRMEELIDDLLTLARQGQAVGKTEQVALDRVASDAWDSIDAPAATLDYWTNVTLEADPDRLRELLENLFRNSVEHGGDNVSISLGELDDGGGFYVEDDGPGIPAEKRDEVFDHGYTTSESGTGFGLSIVERIAEAHDLSVTVTEGSEGGARFEFRTD